MAKSPKTEQAEPTQPAATSAAGFALDRWNLPVSGPARAAALAELGKPDPDHDPDAWAAKDATAAAAVEVAPALDAAPEGDAE